MTLLVIPYTTQKDLTHTFIAVNNNPVIGANGNGPNECSEHNRYGNSEKYTSLKQVLVIQHLALFAFKSA